MKTSSRTHYKIAPPTSSAVHGGLDLIKVRMSAFEMEISVLLSQAEVSLFLGTVAAASSKEIIRTE